MNVLTVPAPAITRPPDKRQEPDNKLIGYWFNDNDNNWDNHTCVGNAEAYTFVGDYVGCIAGEIFTDCVTSSQGTTDSSMLTCMEPKSCSTVLIHSTTPAPTPDPEGKSWIMCRPSDFVVDTGVEFYRVAPTSTSTSTTDSTSSSSSSLTSSTTDTSSSLSVSTTSSGAPQNSQPPAASSQQSTNPGIIAGATIAGVALLILLCFLAWFFGIHRKKERARQAPLPPAQDLNQMQPPYSYQSYEYPKAELPGAQHTIHSELPTDSPGTTRG